MTQKYHNLFFCLLVVLMEYIKHSIFTIFPKWTQRVVFHHLSVWNTVMKYCQFNCVWYYLSNVFCHFKRHRNSVLETKLIIATLAVVNRDQENNQLAWKKGNKIDQNLLITDHRQYVLVEVNFCFLRVPLRWLMAAKHKPSDYQSWCATERCTNSLSNKGVIIQRILNNVFNLCAFGVMTGH